MSQSSRQHIDTTKKYLKSAEQELHHASEHAKQAGDAGLVKRVEKIKTDTAEVRQEIEKKLSPEKG